MAGNKNTGDWMYGNPLNIQENGTARIAAITRKRKSLRNKPAPAKITDVRMAGQPRNIPRKKLSIAYIFSTQQSLRRFVMTFNDLTFIYGH